MQMRTVQVRRKGIWVTIEGLNYIRRGETFRMFEPDGEEVKDLIGGSVFYATSEPYWDDKVGTWLIDATSKPFH